tara:strand:- start:771 stop:1124 length:354 start_codon:yes stop_codon:yes gene_type:complete
MKRFLFKVREFAWEVVSEIADILYPYRTRLSPEEKYEHEMLDPITGEIEMVENLIQSQNERIERLQDEMISVMNRLYQIEQGNKSINTYSENKFNQVNPNERQESSKNSNQTSKTTP